jgi:hypothetical protein
MRSVLLLLRNAPRKQVTDVLNSLYPGQRDPWVRLDAGGDVVLYIHVEDDPLEDLEPGSGARVIAALGGVPSFGLYADVSGRDGRGEVVEWAKALLSRFQGFALDDDGHHLWTLEEIRSEKRVEGRGFFAPPPPGGRGDA